MRRNHLIPLLFALAAACGGTADSQPATPAGNSTPEPAAADDAVGSDAEGADLAQTCVAVMTRQRACTDDFIPALVDLRIELDKPAGIAAAAAAGKRDELIATAMTEWATDGRDENIAAACDDIATKFTGDVAGMQAAADACLERDQCVPYVDCTLALMRGML